MKYPRILGKLTYILIYPAFRLLVYNTKRAYVLVTIKDRVLITKNWIGMQTEWALPGGGMKVGETPQQGAARELKEELGLAIDPAGLKQVGSKFYKSKFGNVYYIFEITFKDRPNLVLDKEIAHSKLCTPVDLQDQKLGEVLRSACKAKGWG